MATEYAHGKIVTDGLVLCLDAADPNSYPGSGTTWYDVAGTNNGTLTNGPTYSNGAIVFDGVNDYVDIPSSPTYKVQFPLSINAWFKLITIPPSPQYTLLETDNPINSFHAGVQIGLTSTGYAVTYGNNTQNNAPGRRSYNATYTFSTNQWYAITAVLPTNLTINTYINGIEISTPYVSGTTTTLAYSTSSMSIGYSNDQGPKYFINGNIATTQIYNRALSSQEVLQNYNATKGRFGL